MNSEQQKLYDTYPCIKCKDGFYCNTACLKMRKWLKCNKSVNNELIAKKH